MRKNKTLNQDRRQTETPVVTRTFFTAVLASSAIISFVLYLVTLAPTVTFEDSGELTAAAYLLGVPHEPGYPLFTMLGHVFTYLPFGTVAYRVNLMSAFFSALGAMFITWTTVLLIENTFDDKTGNNKSFSPAAYYFVLLKYACALSAGLFAATSYENWEQSIITEVYGLNTFFVSLVLTMTLLWSRQSESRSRTKYFYAICFVIGLALSNHPTFVLMIPVLIIYVLITDSKFILNVARLFRGAGCMLAGLLPYAYLPIASARDPQMDWGNPETLTNFFRVIMRHQYQLGDTQTLKKFLSQLSAYGNMILEQWWPAILCLAVIAMWALFKNNRNYFYFALTFLIFTGPLTTFLTNFDVITGNPAVNAENKALVSVFYIPSYLMIAILMVIGVYYIAYRLLQQSKFIVTAVPAIVLLPLVLAYANYRKVDMSQYVFTEDYVDNLFSVVPNNAVVFVNWDPFIFPFNYYQYVEKKRTDVTVVDQELLRRSWYIHSLQIHHAKLMSRAENEVADFLEAVKPFENKEKFDGNFIQSKYIAMINALIDQSYADGNGVFLTYDPPTGVAEKYFKESVIAAVKLRKEINDLTPLNDDSLRFRRFFDESVPLDRMATFFKTYYGRLFFARGFVAEKLMQAHEAARLYEKSAQFLNDNPGYLASVNEARQRLSKVKLKE
ncbi:DUF2723 domain-containing protein [bacterium]|nr:DUF2723 domain-containing protein [bacterium]